jgi:hypothetical protein
MQTGQAQGLPLQGRRRCTSVGATLVVARSMLPVSKTQCKGTYYKNAAAVKADTEVCPDYWGDVESSSLVYRFGRN